MAEQIYYRQADGALVARTASGTDPIKPEPPHGAVLIEKAEYDKALQRIERDRETHRNTVRAEESAQLHEDYEALLAAGVAEATARRLTGFPARA